MRGGSAGHPRTAAQARAAQHGVVHAEAVGEYGYQYDTDGTGLTYEYYVATVLPGKAIPRYMWEALPDPPSAEFHEQLENVKMQRRLLQYRKRVGGFVPQPLLEKGPKIYQIYADPYLKAGTLPPHHHDPQGKPWT